MKCRDCGLSLSFGYWIDSHGPFCHQHALLRGYVQRDGCKPLQPLTEADVRRIVREELAILTGDTGRGS